MRRACGVHAVCMRCAFGVPTLHVSQVTRVSEQEALQCEAYILLYERQREPGRRGGTAEGQSDGRGDGRSEGRRGDGRGEGRSKGRSKGQAVDPGSRAETGSLARRTPHPLSRKQPRRSS